MTRTERAGETRSWAGPLASEVLEAAQRLGVGKRASARGHVGGGAGQDALHWDLQLLARQGLWNAGHRVHRVGHVAGRQDRAQFVREALAEGVVEFGTLGEDSEEEELAEAAYRVLQVHDEAVHHLGLVLDHRVELA